MINKLIHGDCLEEMKQIESKSIDMILCDLPYGITKCKWDAIISFELLWQQYKRIIKDKGAIILTASQPFTSALVMSNPKMFRYEWIWQKNNASNFQNVKNQPLKFHESILIFSKSSPNYYPQGTIPCNIVNSNKGKAGKLGHMTSESKRDVYIQTTSNYPRSIVTFSNNRGLHPTQKPLALCEYLIKTYTQEGDLILDNCFGSGTTLLAAKNLNRQFIGIEKEKSYYDVAMERLGFSSNIGNIINN